MNSLGCKQEIPNPELTDPIYMDLSKELKSLETREEETVKKLETAKKDLEKSAPRTIDRKSAETEIEKAEYTLKIVGQMKEYYEIRLARRKVEDLKAYKAAFAKDQPWPDKEEYEAYLVNKRLMYSSKNWDDRVPKFKSNIKTPDSKESKNESGGEEGKSTEKAPKH
ncbi:MAG: hypothetical protein ABL927_00805 [Bdellovibrionales bacterium]